MDLVYNQQTSFSKYRANETVGDATVPAAISDKTSSKCVLIFMILLGEDCCSSDCVTARYKVQKVHLFIEHVVFKGEFYEMQNG